MHNYLKPRPRFVVLLVGAALVLGILAIYAAAMAVGRHTQADAIVQQAERLRVAQVVKPTPVPSRTELEEQKRWAVFKLERDFSWAPLFNALQVAGNPNIELLEFQPDKAGGRVMLRGEARDEEALIAFMETLAAQPLLRNVHLSHRKIKRRDRLVTVAFEIKAAMRRDSSVSPAN
ncbi:PilN domain-containing protein [Rugamonas sp. CCM 8940]|uniref:PilN domain-containing protein n=1 Tax=Rugamonas sp. CCM 8940 TaxID=2765359 RepID=UPI0018F7B754|nr:PilN domain-containing protein [Rugamonas sp. CCM 8940]MBJ7311489.1 PilN domain-containing protein [Rugamonas sp. CCM 8940]